MELLQGITYSHLNDLNAFLDEIYNNRGKYSNLELLKKVEFVMKVLGKSLELEKELKEKNKASQKSLSAWKFRELYHYAIFSRMLEEKMFMGSGPKFIGDN